MSASLDIKADPYGSQTPSPLPNPTRGGGGEPVPAPGLPDSLPSYIKPIPVNTRDIQHVMRGHLNAAEPRVRRWLYSTWGAQRDAIKYQELRNAVRDGQMPAKWIAQWQRGYAALVADEIAPQWRDTMESASASIANAARAEGVELSGELTAHRVNAWIEARGGELIVNLTERQERATRAILQRYTMGPNPVSADELGRIIRPLVGLTPKQAGAVARYRDLLVEEGLPKRKVDHMVGNYAGRLHRVRADRIARTELAFAYNNGILESMRSAVDAEDMRGRIVKEFLTSDDERVCPHCGPMDGQTIELEETFPGATTRLPNMFMPPLHPGCRCSVVMIILRDTRTQE